MSDVPLHDTYFVVAHFHLVMGVAAIMGIFAGIYHWYPKVTGRMMNELLGKIHFFVTFVGAYLVFFPMFLAGLQGMPRRYYSFEGITNIAASTAGLNRFITIAALTVGAAQVLFLVNLIVSALAGAKADRNPWRSGSLEWQTPELIPGHGNWGPDAPVVYRWPYDYSLPGASADFVPQNAPGEAHR
jgi:cytochrome c oxidase subunit 1